MRKIKIKIPLYTGDFIIIQTDDFKKVEDKYNLTDLNRYSAIAFSRPNKNEYSRYFMVCRSNVDAGIIAHECLHIANNIFKDSGITTDNINDEPHAYLLGWLVEECHKFLNIKKANA